MTRIKGYYTMEELAKELGWSYPGALDLAKTLCLRRLGRLYMVSEDEAQTITNMLAELGCELLELRENE